MLDGTEIVALLVSKSSHLLKVGDVILILNVFIYLLSRRILSRHRVGSLFDSYLLRRLEDG